MRALVITDPNDAAYRVLCELFLDEQEDDAARCAAADALAGNEAAAAMAVNILTRAVQATRGELPVRPAALAAVRARLRAACRPGWSGVMACMAYPGGDTRPPS